MMSCLPSLTGVGADGMWPLSSRIYCGAETLEPKRRVSRQFDCSALLYNNGIGRATITQRRRQMHQIPTHAMTGSCTVDLTVTVT